jgi:putative FmdB family regulatory protein
MRVTDYKCDSCGHVFDVWKKDLENWKSRVKCPECNLQKAKRVFGIGDIDVAEGKLGNASNGYKTGITYHPSKYGSSYKK